MNIPVLIKPAQTAPASAHKNVADPVQALTPKAAALSLTPVASDGLSGEQKPVTRTKLASAADQESVAAEDAGVAGSRKAQPAKARAMSLHEGLLKKQYYELLKTEHKARVGTPSREARQWPSERPWDRNTFYKVQRQWTRRDAPEFKQIAEAFAEFFDHSHPADPTNPQLAGPKKK